MATIKAFTDRFIAIDFEQVAADSFKETEEQLLAKNIEQLNLGFDKDGNRLTPYKSDIYANMKNIQNPSAGYGNPDLKRTGAYHAGYKVEQGSGTTYEIISTDTKAADLDEKYERKQYGLNSQGKSEYIEEDYLPVLTSNIRAKAY